MFKGEDIGLFVYSCECAGIRNQNTEPVLKVQVLQKQNNVLSCAIKLIEKLSRALVLKSNFSSRDWTGLATATK